MSYDELQHRKEPKETAPGGKKPVQGRDRERLGAEQKKLVVVHGPRPAEGSPPAHGRWSAATGVQEGDFLDGRQRSPAVAGSITT